jgi:hypothetical protein
MRFDLLPREDSNLQPFGLRLTVFDDCQKLP